MAALMGSFSIYADSGRTLPDQLMSCENGRFLVDGGGEPFYYMGDTAWEIFHRLDRDEAERYLQDRAQKHFTVIQTVALAERDGLRDPNPYGHLPLVDMDPSRPAVVEGPDNDYWDHVDWTIKRANELGLYVALLPTWGDKIRQKWGLGPEVFTMENAFAYGEWIGKRYRDYKVIFVVNGDRKIEDQEHQDIVESLASGLEKGSEGRRLITFHPGGGDGSARYFHNADWLDFNMRQSGHFLPYEFRYKDIGEDYLRAPAKPLIDAEPLYEDHPIRPDKHHYSTAADVRRGVYWGLFSGGFGHVYGHHCIWQFWEPGLVGVNNPAMAWQDALARPGSSQMQYARWLLESRPFLERVPDDSVIVPDAVPGFVPGNEDRRFKATRHQNGAYAMVYAPVSRSFTVDLDVIKGQKVRAWWYDPRNGEATEIGVFEGGGHRRFVPPTDGENLDWILVLDDDRLAFPPPGSRRR